MYVSKYRRKNSLNTKKKGQYLNLKIWKSISNPSKTFALERPRFIIKVEIKGCCSVQCLTEVWTRLRDNGKIDIVKPGVYEIKAFAIEYF